MEKCNSVELNTVSTYLSSLLGVIAEYNKMNSLYQIHSKMLHSKKVIILVGKKRKEVAWLRFELTTSILESESANLYTMDPP